MNWVIGKRIDLAIAAAKADVVEAAQKFGAAFRCIDEAEARGTHPSELAPYRLALLQSFVSEWAPRAEAHAETLGSPTAQAGWIRDLAKAIRTAAEWYCKAHLDGTLLLEQPIESLMRPWEVVAQRLDLEALRIIGIEEAATLLRTAAMSLTSSIGTAAECVNLAWQRLADAERGGADAAALRTARAKLLQFAMAEYAPEAARQAAALDDERCADMCGSLAQCLRTGRDWFARETELGNITSRFFESKRGELNEMIAELETAHRAMTEEIEMGAQQA